MTTKENKQYRIVPVGERGVGKTSITVRFVAGQFIEEYDPTLEDSYRKQCVVDKEMVLIELFDPASQDDWRGTNFWSRFINQGDGIVLMYSVTSRTAFEGVKNFHQDVLQIKKQDSFPMVLVANKCDVAYDRQVSLAEGEELAKQFGCYFFEASAKTGTNIDAAVYELVREIKKGRTEQSPILANANQNDDQHDGGCCGSCVVL